METVSPEVKQQAESMLKQAKELEKQAENLINQKQQIMQDSETTLDKCNAVIQSMYQMPQMIMNSMVVMPFCMPFCIPFMQMNPFNLMFNMQIQNNNLMGATIQNLINGIEMELQAQQLKIQAEQLKIQAHLVLNKPSADDIKN
jgi:hypothetical protein